MRKILFISLPIFILLIVFFNYPIFDSKGLSYLAILSCFTIICFTGAKYYTSNDKNDYDSLEKLNDELHENDGIFKYSNDGFYIHLKNSTEYIKWSNIKEVNSFSVPIITGDRQTGLEIITNEKNYEFLDDITLGIQKLTDKLCENLPTWQINSIPQRINNFGLEKVRLYTSENK